MIDGAQRCTDDQSTTGEDLPRFVTAIGAAGEPDWRGTASTDRQTYGEEHETTAVSGNPATA